MVTAEIATLRAADADCASGALVSFEGAVRADGDVRDLFLEHYPGMTDHALRALAEDAAARWSLTGVVLVHRVGRILPGEVIVLAVAAAAHRRAAFQACTYLVDALKTDIPLWKKQRYRDGREEWIESRSEDDRARAAWQR